MSQRSHAQHKGERYIQQRRQTPNALTEQIPHYISTYMPSQHAAFFAELPYLPLATLDNQGRPWVSLLVTSSKMDPSIGIKIPSHNGLNINAHVNPYDPFVRAINQSKAATPNEKILFAGVGVDFSNRRRNKIAGTIAHVQTQSPEKIQLHLTSDEHLGNCPKYITIRSLEPYCRKAEMGLDHFSNITSPLSSSCKEVINQASTVFLASTHTPDGTNTEEDQKDMGLNHRGGAPGFVRVYEETKHTVNGGDSTSTYLILPDYSGNRFYQSLGNIQSNKHVGLTFPDFNNGHLLYVTGEAENVFDDDAEALMPRISLLTRIRVTGVVFIKHALNLRMTSQEQYSPYNPPVRYLRQELEQMGHTANANTSPDTPIKATLISSQKLTDNISTFTFKLSSPIHAPLPGGFGVFDFSKNINFGYSHMDEINPQNVNEDYIRTWTLSSAPSFDENKKQFAPMQKISITVKRKKGGLISNILHKNSSTHTQTHSQTLHTQYKGSGVGFSCFDQKTPNERPHIPSHMLWVAGGVGITPFMSMWDGILNLHQTLPKEHTTFATDIVLIFSGRDDDLNVIRHFLTRIDSLPSNITMRIFAYQSKGNEENKDQTTLNTLLQEFPKASLAIKQRRLQSSDFENIEHLIKREVFLCGPDTLIENAQTFLQKQGVDKLKYHRESYFF